jgi:hypothetical protein
MLSELLSYDIPRWAVTAALTLSATLQLTLALVR